MSVYIPIALERRLRERFDNCCAYCRTAEHLTTITLEIEHIVPISAKGETVFENLCLACPTCNRYKSTLMAAIDPVTQKEVVLFHPQRDNWADHFAWNDDSTRVLGLTPSGRATVAVMKMNRRQMLGIRQVWVEAGKHPPFHD